MDEKEQLAVWWPQPQQTVSLCLTMHFGFWASEESRKPCWEDIELGEDPQTGWEMLIWKAEREIKTHQGQESGHRRQSLQKLKGVLSSFTRVSRLTNQQRPKSQNVNNKILTLNSKHRVGDCVWFKYAPLRKNVLPSSHLPQQRVPHWQTRHPRRFQIIQWGRPAFPDCWMPTFLTTMRCNWAATRTNKASVHTNQDDWATSSWCQTHRVIQIFCCICKSSSQQI